LKFDVLVDMLTVNVSLLSSMLKILVLCLEILNEEIFTSPPAQDSCYAPRGWGCRLLCLSWLMHWQRRREQDWHPQEDCTCVKSLDMTTACVWPHCTRADPSHGLFGQPLTVPQPSGITAQSNWAPTCATSASFLHRNVHRTTRNGKSRGDSYAIHDTRHWWWYDDDDDRQIDRLLKL